MPHTIQCPECGVVLNVPDTAAGKKLKCPKCATMFRAPSRPGDSAIAGSPDSSSLTSRNPASSGSLILPSPSREAGSGSHPTQPSRSSGTGSHPTQPTRSSGTGSHPTQPTRSASSGSHKTPAPRPESGGGIELPSSPVPFRETFDLPMLDDLGPTTAPAAKPAKVPTAADAMALFQDEPKANRRPKTGAEARAKARRCPTCGGVVPVGMSLCGTCGLDLDTGRREVPLEVFDEEMPETIGDPMPGMGVMLVGGVTAMTSILLTFVTIFGWSQGLEGAPFLLIVCLFGVYASVQFLRRKSARLLFVAITLGAAIAAVGLIALPIYYANTAATEPETTELVNQPTPDGDDGPVIHSITEKLDTSKILWGVFTLLGYAGVSIYLASPAMRREFAKK
jgi:hypothetical protein